MTGFGAARVLVAAVVLALCGCQPAPVVGTVVDKFSYPGGTIGGCADLAGHEACTATDEPARFYVSVRSDADPDGPTHQIRVDQYLWLDLDVGDRFDELEMVGP